MTAALLLIALASGHEGEDHGAPPPPTAATAEADRLPTWSTEFDAVVRLPYAAPGEEAHGAVLIADHNTSAPLAAAQLTLTFGGPAPVEAHVAAPSQPGVFPFTVTFPEHGTYTGGLTVIAADRADMLGLPPLVYAPPEAHPAHDDGWGWAWIAAAVAGGLLAGALAGLAAGFGAGRLSKRGAPLLALALALAARPATAHEGEDHAAPAAPAAASGGDLTLPMESQFLLGVRTALVRAQPIAATEPILGRAVIRPGGGAELAAPVTGTVEFPAEIVPGMQVQKGQLLAVIHESLTGPERADVLAGRTSAQTELARARRELALAERDAARADQLGGVISERERLDRIASAEVAREAVRQAEIAAGGIGSTSTRVVAPVTGRLGAIGARPGEGVAQGAPLFTVLDDGPLWIEAQLPEAVAGRLLAGAEASVTIPARPGEVLPARVLDPGLAADPASGMFRVTLELAEPDDGLRPGMSATGWVTVGEPREAVVIPDEAIVESNGQTIVFVKISPETFAVREVALGVAAAGRREVVRGLAPNERVVVDGTYPLRSLAGR